MLISYGRFLPVVPSCRSCGVIFYSRFGGMLKSARRSFVYHSVGPQVCHVNVSSSMYFNWRFVHTFKSWKAKANPKLADSHDYEQRSVPARTCEEGTGAVSHDELLFFLNNCKTVNEQINTLSSVLSMSPEEIVNRQNFCDSLQKLLKPFFPECQIRQFGSSMNTFGFKGCDIDVFIKTIFNDDDEPVKFVKVQETPDVNDVLSGKVDLSTLAYLYPKQRLYFIRKVIHSHSEDIRKPVFIVHSKNPILRFYSEKHDLYCDFSCENRSAVKNTKLLRFISHFDERVGLLVKTLRYWGKHKKFVGDVDMFHSYGFTLLVLFFLQNTAPRVLPPIKELVEKSDYIKFGDVADDDLLFRSLKNIPPSENKQEPESLLKEFFFFYTYYDFKRVMLVLSGYSVPLVDIQSAENAPTGNFKVGPLCLQDPFRHSYNSAYGISNKNAAKFLSSLIEACKMYQNENIWVPSTQNWGISSLLETSSYSVLHENDSVENKLESFTINVKPEVLECLSEKYDSTQDAQLELLNRTSNLIKEVLEYGLLFKCTSFNHTEDSCDSRPEVKFHCEAPYNTWIGRHRVLKASNYNAIVDNPLELEHLISLNLAQQTLNKCQVICRFTWQCSLISETDHPTLKVDVNFISGKFHSVVSIFLKDYIPKLVECLL